jgi:hypothetical protein
LPPNAVRRARLSKQKLRPSALFEATYLTGLHKAGVSDNLRRHAKGISREDFAH